MTTRLHPIDTFANIAGVSCLKGCLLSYRRSVVGKDAVLTSQKGVAAMKQCVVALLVAVVCCGGCTPNSVPGTESSPIREGSYEGTLTVTAASWAGTDHREASDSMSYVEMFDSRGIPLSITGETLVVGYKQQVDLLGIITGTETLTNVNANNSGLILAWETVAALPDGTPMMGTWQDIYTLRSDGTVSYSGGGTLHTDDGFSGLQVHGEGILSIR